MARNCPRRYYTIGESRLIEWDLRPSRPGDILVVTEGKYKIYKGEVLFKEGNLTVNGNYVSLNFEAVEGGEFLVKIFVTVPPETLSTEIIAQVD